MWSNIKKSFESISKHQKDIELVSICDDDQVVLSTHEKSIILKDIWILLT